MNLTFDEHCNHKLNVYAFYVNIYSSEKNPDANAPLMWLVNGCCLYQNVSLALSL